MTEDGGEKEDCEGKRAHLSTMHLNMMRRSASLREKGVGACPEAEMMFISGNSFSRFCLWPRPCGDLTNAIAVTDTLDLTDTRWRYFATSARSCSISSVVKLGPADLPCFRVELRRNLWSYRGGHRDTQKKRQTRGRRRGTVWRRAGKWLQKSSEGDDGRNSHEMKRRQIVPFARSKGREADIWRREE